MTKYIKATKGYFSPICIIAGVRPTHEEFGSLVHLLLRSCLVKFSCNEICTVFSINNTRFFHAIFPFCFHCFKRVYFVVLLSSICSKWHVMSSVLSDKFHPHGALYLPLLKRNYLNYQQMAGHSFLLILWSSGILNASTVRGSDISGSIASNPPLYVVRGRTRPQGLS